MAAQEFGSTLSIPRECRTVAQGRGSAGSLASSSATWILASRARVAAPGPFCACTLLNIIGV